MKTKSRNLRRRSLLVIFLATFTALLTACGAHPDEMGGSGTVGAESTCSAGNLYTFQNENSYPIWLGEGYQGSGNLNSNIIAPPNNNWMMAAKSSVDLCMPAGWSGRFWPRTECDFTTPYSHDPGYKSCTATSQCSSGHLCMGGKCLLNCSTGSTPFCQSAQGLNNQNAICIKSSFAGQAQFCGYPEGMVCKTGDCQGLYQCYGQWDSNVALFGPGSPVSLFEPTSTTAAIVNYDVSLVSGYNSEMKITPSPSACSATGCVSDLNASCPANLQVTEAPTTTAGPIPCGSGKYCQSGACKNNNTCVIGCNDPGDQCTSSNPADLMCHAVVPNGDGSTYADMYLAKNFSGNINQGLNKTMISGNQGTPTCWGNADCLPTEICATSLIPGFPTGIGICTLPSGFIQPQTGCMQPNEVGGACSNYVGDGFANGLGYKCETAGTNANNLACVPAYNPPTIGLGQLETASGGGPTFFSGTGSFMNPEWQTAAKQAGNGTPWYEIFSNACPHTYGWQYDDHAGGFSCNTSGNGGGNVNMTITFGPAITTTITSSEKPAAPK